MSKEICDYQSCTGCSTCASVCPKSCIHMVSDREGFLRPLIDEELCVNCNLCRKHCPVNNPPEDDGLKPKSFAARCKDESVVAQSSSGGLFSVFARFILEKGGVVIGAGFDDNHQVVHKICSDVNKLDELRRSKYVQSRIETVYHDAKKILESGNSVLFCGTPCQIGGIKAYLGKEYDSLLTVDFICHGTPSPLAYNHYLDYLKKKHHSEIQEVNFRSKIRGWHTHSLSVKFANGIEHNESVSQDYYMRSFIMDMNLRPSCYKCKFKQIHRISDITIADFWGSEQIVSNWNDDTGISLAMIHSENGKQLFDSCRDKLESIKVDFKDAIKSNPSMICSVKKPPLRDAFMKDLYQLPYDRLHDKYCGTNFLARLRRKIASVIYNV